MNNVLAQNATQLAVSTNTPENYPFEERVAVIAKRKMSASGLTTRSFSINRGALISGVCSDFRNTFPLLFAKRDDKGNIIDSINRVSDEYLDIIVKHVDEFIEARFKEFTDHLDQCKVNNSRFIHQSAKKDVFIRHTIVRDEVIGLQQKRLGINLFIGETKRQIAKLNAQQSVLSEKTEERLQKLEKRLTKETETLNEINMLIAAQKPAEKIVEKNK